MIRRQRTPASQVLLPAGKRFARRREDQINRNVEPRLTGQLHCLLDISGRVVPFQPLQLVGVKGLRPKTQPRHAMFGQQAGFVRGDVRRIGFDAELPFRKRAKTSAGSW